MIFSKDNEAMAEIDGAFLRIHGKSLWITLVESKNLRKHGDSKSIQQLRDVVAKLGIKKANLLKKGSYSVAEFRVP